MGQDRMGTIITIAGICLPVLLALTAWRMAYLGVHVTLHPAKKTADKEKLKREFYALAGVIVFLTLGQGLLNFLDRQAQHQELADFKEKPMQVQVPGFFQFNGIRQLDIDQGNPLVREGYPVRFNVTFNNIGGLPVFGAQFVSKIWTIRANTESDFEIRRNFTKMTESEVATLKHGQTVSIRGELFKTVSSDHALTKEDVADIIAGRLRVYLISHYWSQTRPDGDDLCNWIGGPTDPVGSTSFSNIAWHNCG
jgi:hypothetical protein